MDLIWSGIVEGIGILIYGKKDIWEITLRTLLISGSATIIALFIGISLGSLLSFCRFPGRNLFIAFANTGMGLPPVVVGLIVAIIVWRSGPLGFLDIMYSPVSMVIAQVIIAVPLVVVFTVAALCTLPDQLRMQVYALGASRLQMFWVIFKEAKLTVLAALMAGFGAAISEIGASQMVGGNLAGDTRVLTTAVMLDVQRGDFSSAIAISFILLGLIFVISLIITLTQLRGGIVDAKN